MTHFVAKISKFVNYFTICLFSSSLYHNLKTKIPCTPFATKPSLSGVHTAVDCKRSVTESVTVPLQCLLCLLAIFMPRRDDDVLPRTRQGIGFHKVFDGGACPLVVHSETFLCSVKQAKMIANDSLFIFIAVS